MATSVNLGYCPWLAGSTFSDVIGRADIDSTTFGPQTMGGVLAGGIGDLAVVTVSGMNINASPGTAIVPNSSGSGQYRVFNPTAATLTVPTAPVSPNSRIDLICVTVVDNGNSTSYSEVQLVTGTPGTSPSAPSLPTNSIPLAQVLVGSGVSTINQSNITDTRTWTSEAGGVINCPNMSSLPTGDIGTIGFDMVNTRYFQLASTGAKPFKTKPFSPAHLIGNTAATLTGNTGSGGTLTTLVFGSQSMSTSVTCDGITDLEITTHWSGISMATPTATEVQFAIFIDSTQLDLITLEVGATSQTWPYAGGTNIYTTSAAAGDTPSAAAHTITWRAVANQQSAAESLSIVAGTGHLAYLRVVPVSL
jgi:hypothetical protein